MPSYKEILENTFKNICKELYETYMFSIPEKENILQIIGDVWENPIKDRSKYMKLFDAVYQICCHQQEDIAYKLFVLFMIKNSDLHKAFSFLNKHYIPEYKKKSGFYNSYNLDVKKVIEKVSQSVVDKDKHKYLSNIGFNSETIFVKNINGVTISYIFIKNLGYVEITYEKDYFETLPFKKEMIREQNIKNYKETVEKAWKDGDEHFKDIPKDMINEFQKYL